MPGISTRYRPRSSDHPLPGVYTDKTVVLFSARRVFVIFALSAVLLVLLIVQILTPFRQAVARRYVLRGDEYVKSVNLAAAKTEYEVALKYDAGNSVASSHLEMAQAGLLDPVSALNLYRELGVESEVVAIESAVKNFDNAKLALETGLSLMSQGRPELAQYPILKATKLDPGYPEAWNYLGQVYDVLSKSPTGGDFTVKSREAFAKRDDLTTGYLNIGGSK